MNAAPSQKQDTGLLKTVGAYNLYKKLFNLAAHAHQRFNFCLPQFAEHISVILHTGLLCMRYVDIVDSSKVNVCRAQHFDSTCTSLSRIGSVGPQMISTNQASMLWHGNKDGKLLYLGEETSNACNIYCWYTFTLIAVRFLLHPPPHQDVGSRMFCCASLLSSLHTM